jgi:HlyD family secretion protein
MKPSPLSRSLGAPRALARRISRKNRLLIAILGGCALATGTLMATAPQPDPPASEEKSWPVSTVTAQPATLSPELQLYGRVESPHHASLSSALSAQVLAVHVQEGQRVEAGELLLSLDPGEEQLRLQQAEADVQDAQARLAEVETDFGTDQQVLGHMRELYELTSAKAERLKNLNQRQLIATEQMENTLQEVARQGIELARQQALVDKHPQRLASARAAVEHARAALDNQRLNLERTRILAPFDGRISALQASPGDRVTAGSPLLSLYDTGALQVRAALPSASLPTLKQALAEGRSITAWVGDEDIPLALSELAGAVERGRSGVDGLFALPEGGAGLELGRAVALTLALPPVDNAVALPLQSLYNNQRIYVIEDQRLRGIDVQPLGQRIGDRGELQVLVDGGQLPAGASVLATSLPRAATGLRVAPVGSALARRDSGDGAQRPAPLPASGTASATASTDSAAQEAPQQG